MLTETLRSVGISPGAQWFWEELRRADDVEQCDLLVADYLDTTDGPGGC